MLQIYEIDYDQKLGEYFITLSPKDRLVIQVPNWLSFRVQPHFVFNHEKIRISDDELAPTYLELRTGDKIEVVKKMWLPNGDFLPTLKINGITTLNKHRLHPLDRFIVFMPLLIVFFGGLHGGLCGVVAVCLNIGLMRAPWQRWQKTVASLTTSAVAALIYFTGVVTLAAYLHIPNAKLEDIHQGEFGIEQLYTSEEERRTKRMQEHLLQKQAEKAKHTPTRPEAPSEPEADDPENGGYGSN